MNAQTPNAITPTLIARFTEEWRGIAGEAIRVNPIGSAIVAKGTELAVRRLEHVYRYAPNARAFQSTHLQSWVFSLDVSQPVPWRLAAAASFVPLRVTPCQLSQGDRLCIEDHRSNVWARTPGHTAQDQVRAERLVHEHNANPELLELLEQCRAALPDAWFAVKSSVPRELIETLDHVLERQQR